LKTKTKSNEWYGGASSRSVKEEVIYVITLKPTTTWRRMGVEQFVQ
jgi:hypothetical protein